MDEHNKMIEIANINEIILSKDARRSDSVLSGFETILKIDILLYGKCGISYY